MVPASGGGAPNLVDRAGKRGKIRPQGKAFAFRAGSSHSLPMTQPLALVCYEKLLPGSQLVNRLQDLKYRVRPVADARLLVDCARQEKPMICTGRCGLQLAGRMRRCCATEAASGDPAYSGDRDRSRARGRYPAGGPRRRSDAGGQRRGGAEPPHAVSRTGTSGRVTLRRRGVDVPVTMLLPAPCAVNIVARNKLATNPLTASARTPIVALN